MYNLKKDRKTLSVIAEQLPLIPDPFTVYAKQIGTDTASVIQLIKDFVSQGVIRRFAGILQHDSAGYHSNAMIAFEVDSDLCDQMGGILAEHKSITHCYRRKTYPDWPYNLYAMLHAHDAHELHLLLTQIKEKIMYKSILVLPTIRQFKKTQFKLQEK